MSIRQNLSDRRVIRSGSETTGKVVRRRYPFLIAPLIWLLQFVIRSASFSVRVFIRQKPGQRTYGIGLIAFSYIWTRYFMLDHVSFRFLKPGGAKVLSFLGLDTVDSLFYPVYLAVYYVWQFFAQIWPMFRAVFYTAPEDGSVYVFWFSYAVVFLGLFNLVRATKENLFYEPGYSYDRGKSFVFQGLEGKRFRIFKRTLVISDNFIRIILDPLLIIGLGALCQTHLDNNFGVMLMISGGALFLEERSDYIRRLDQVLDAIDGRFEGERVQAEIRKYDDLEAVRSAGALQGAGPAVLAGPEDIRTYQKHIQKQKSRSAAGKPVARVS